jgi:hypothetical protein
MASPDHGTAHLLERQGASVVVLARGRLREVASDLRDLDLGHTAHARYNGLIRRLVSFERAAECARCADEP